MLTGGWFIAWRRFQTRDSAHVKRTKTGFIRFEMSKHEFHQKLNEIK